MLTHNLIITITDEQQLLPADVEIQLDLIEV